MNLYFDKTLAVGYKSVPQQIRVMSEAWLAHNIYCPDCGNPVLTSFENNRPVADFYCDNCGETFELKSKNGHIGRKISDGAYQTAIERINSNTNPNLFVLSYSPDLQVLDLNIIPKFFFVDNVIEKRKPLAETARRAGWTGCNIIYSDIPKQGKIAIIENSTVTPKETVLDNYRQSKKLKKDDIKTREWLMDILQCVNSIKTTAFSLSDIYEFEEMLALKHPLNNNIRAKIRQQLQILRDMGFIQFSGGGKYRKTY